MGLSADRARSRSRRHGPHRRQPDRQVGRRHGHLGRHSARRSASPSPPCSAATRTGCGSATCSASPSRRRWWPRRSGCATLRHHHVQGESRPHAVRARRRRRAARCAKSSATDIELYVDGNRGWTASESLRALNAMADLDLTLAEELCPADDVLGRRWLVERCPVPFVADESAHDPATSPANCSAAPPPRSASRPPAPASRTRSASLFHCDGLGVEVVMGNQIDGQLGTAVHGHLRRGLQLHHPAGRRALQLPGHERRPARRAAGDPWTAGSRSARRRPRHRASTPTSSRTTASTAQLTPKPTPTRRPTKQRPTEEMSQRSTTADRHLTPRPQSPAASATERFRDSDK